MIPPTCSANRRLAATATKGVRLRRTETGGGMNRCAIAWLSIYRNYLSIFKLQSCRFMPSCSAYALEAFQHYPFLSAARLTLRRLWRCHPWGSWGWDPLPARSPTTR